jgi:hypothetical protein
MTDRWWVIHEDDIEEALIRAHEGGEPALVLADLDCEANREYIEPGVSAQLPDEHDTALIEAARAWRADVIPGTSSTGMRCHRALIAAVDRHQEAHP